MSWAQEPPLVRFAVLTLTTVGAIRSAGLRLEPTGRNRCHYTVAFDDLAGGIEALCRLTHQVWPNPYHQD